jgi:transposase
MAHYNRTAVKFYCGVDLHKKNSYVYVVGLTGEKVQSREISTNQKSFEVFFSSYRASEILLAVEVSSMTFWLCDVLNRIGFQVYVVNTLENHYLSHSIKKTDKEDARKLAIQLWKDILPPPVYIPLKEERALRRLVSHRHVLVKSLTRVINRTSHMLANYEIKFSRRALTSMARWQQLFECFEKGVHPADLKGEENLVAMDDILLSEFTSNFDQFTLLRTQIAEMEKNLLSKLKEVPRFNRMYQNLLTIPGVGPITSAALIGCIGEIGRFKSSRQMVSYLGLSPKVRESGGKVLSSNGGITKRGNSRLRGYFTQAAIGLLSSRHTDAQPLKEWYQRIRKKKGWRIARVALARKLATIAFGVLKTDSPYEPAKTINHKDQCET